HGWRGGGPMSSKFGIFAAGLTATAVICAPGAGAEPVWPVAGAENAKDTIDDLEGQGYDVRINWVSGLPSVSLYRCKVTGINNPNPSPPTGDTLETVYVDVSCPNPDNDYWGGIGIGFGF